MNWWMDGWTLLYWKLMLRSYVIEWYVEYFPNLSWGCSWLRWVLAILCFIFPINYWLIFYSNFKQLSFEVTKWLMIFPEQTGSLRCVSVSHCMDVILSVIRNINVYFFSLLIVLKHLWEAIKCAHNFFSMALG